MARERFFLELDPPEASLKSLPHVVIVGGGFAGLKACHALIGKPVRVTLIDKRNFNLFQPLLYQVASGLVSKGDVASPLRQMVGQAPNVQVLLGDSNGAAPGQPPRPPAFDLVIAADGPASATRAALGIRSWGWDYRQHCLTAEIELRGAPPDRAWEVFRPEGPMAVLPLGEGLAQLVWSAPASRCREREALDPAAFLDRLSGVLPPPLEPDGLRDRPKAFPVGLRLASRLSRGRTLLVGESAHRCHPVGGQGLNLCWRDVAELHRLACRATAGRLAPERIGAAYSLRRLPDLLLVLLATDLLVRLHSNRQPALLPLRRLALALLARSRSLRRLVLGLMSDGLPTLPIGGGVGSLTPW